MTVALIDTGVSAEADGLGRNVEHLNLSDGAAGDGLGHGTFLAGIIAGTGKFKGVAPGADILDVQVADETGATSLWTVLKGLDAATSAVRMWSTSACRPTAPFPRRSTRCRAPSSTVGRGSDRGGRGGQRRTGMGHRRFTRGTTPT